MLIYYHDKITIDIYDCYFNILKSKMSRISLNVEGVLFYTTTDTLCKSKFFNNMFIDCDIFRDCDITEQIFLDRDSVSFRHVLNFLRDVEYRFPSHLKYELDYYGIVYDESKLYEDLDNATIVHKLEIISEKLEKWIATKSVPGKRGLQGEMGKIGRHGEPGKDALHSSNINGLRDNPSFSNPW